MLKNIDRKTTKTYVGFTNNLAERLKKHNSNRGAKSTSYHLSRTVPGIESEWLDLWKKNYNEIYGGP